MNKEYFFIKAVTADGKFVQYHVGQYIEKMRIRIVRIIYDNNEWIRTRNKVYRIFAETEDGIEFDWMGLENFTNLQYINFLPNLTVDDMLKITINEYENESSGD